MKPLLILSLLSLLVVSALPASAAESSQQPRFEKPVRSAINRPPLNTNTPLMDIETIRAKHLGLIDDMIARNTEHAAHISSQTALHEDLRTAILADLATEASQLTNTRTAVASATSLQELKAAMQTVRELMNTRKEKIAQRKVDMQKRAQEKAQNMEAKEHSILEKMNAAVTKLQSLNIDTSTIETAITTYTEHVNALDAKNSSIEDLKTKTAQLRAEAKAILESIKTAASNAAQ